MPFPDINNIDFDRTGSEMYELISELYPFCRSITGNGVRQTLDSLQKHIHLKINEVPTGTKAFDWEVPREWNIKDAYIKNSKGEKIIDFYKSNLHVLNYSIPVNKNAHHLQLPETPCVRTISVTRLGVSVEKVVATIEIPNNHHGIFLPERKNSEELFPARLDVINPINRITIKNAKMMVQSIACRIMDFFPHENILRFCSRSFG